MSIEMGPYEKSSKNKQPDDFQLGGQTHSEAIGTDMVSGNTED